MDLDSILSFTKFIGSFKEIKRNIHHKYDNNPENDAEHSWQLAMLSWYIISTKKLNLDLSKVIKYSLVHDLVEIHAGDEEAMYRTEDQAKSKHDREMEALENIAKSFPEVPSITDSIRDYENRVDPESHFVYAVDKFICVANIYNDDGHEWKRGGWTLEDEIVFKQGKKGLEENIDKLWDQLLEYMKQREDELFDIKEGIS